MDRYEAKQAYIENKIGENMQIETLTEDQHIALNDLCRIRHEMHCNHDGFFNTESQYYNKFWALIDNGINEMLTNVGLEKINFDYDEFEMVTDVDYADMGYSYDDAIQFVYNITEGFNEEIEKYLREIDRKHGTHYAPTGMARFKAI